MGAIRHNTLFLCIRSCVILDLSLTDAREPETVPSYDKGRCFIETGEERGGPNGTQSFNCHPVLQLCLY